MTHTAMLWRAEIRAVVALFVVVLMLSTTLAFAISVYAFVQCWRTPGLERKWLWALFTLVGFCAFSLNWTTGGFNVNPLSFNLFSAGAVRDGFVGPWVITFAFPLARLCSC